MTEFSAISWKNKKRRAFIPRWFWIKDSWLRSSAPAKKKWSGKTIDPSIDIGVKGS